MHSTWSRVTFSRGRELKLGDPAKVLERMLDYINSKLHQQSRSKGREFLTDLNLFACTEDRLCVVGTGGAAIFLSHQGKAKEVLGDEATSDLLGRGKGVHFSRLDSPVWSGDLIIMLSPALAEVFGNREISWSSRRRAIPIRPPCSSTPWPPASNWKEISFRSSGRFPSWRRAGRALSSPSPWR